MKDRQQDLGKREQKPHPIIAIKDRIGRVPSIDNLSKGQEVEHRAKQRMHYRRAKVAGFSDLNLQTGGRDVTRVILKNEVEYDSSSTDVTNEELQTGKQIV